MLYEKLQKQIKEAMLAKNTDLRDVLKQVQMKTQAYAKENKVDISDEIVLDSVRKEIKQLNQTKASLGINTECKLYKSTAYKINVLEEYLPQQLSTEECLEEVESILSGLNSNVLKNKGAVIGEVMKQLKGKADNKMIVTCVETVLKGKEEVYK